MTGSTGLRAFFNQALLGLLCGALVACSGGGGGTSTSSPDSDYIDSGYTSTAVVSGFAGMPANADGVGVDADVRHPSTTVFLNGYLYTLKGGYWSYGLRKINVATGAVSTLPLSNGYSGIATDGSQLYLAESYRLDKIDPATGAVLQAFSPQGGSPAVAADSTNLYTYSGYAVYKTVIATGVRTLLAGQSTGVTGKVNGTGAAASFGAGGGLGCQSIATDGTNLYVADYYNNMIRKVVITTGEVTTLASVSRPTALLNDGASLYVNGSSIIKITKATGVVTTLVAAGGAQFGDSNGIASDGTNLYVAETYTNLIRKLVISTGVVTTLVGTTAPTDGSATLARFTTPNDLASDGTSLYVADTNGSAIRKVSLASGAVTTFVSGFNPECIVIDGNTLYFADHDSIYKVALATGVTTKLASVGGSGLTSDGANLYVVSGNVILKVVIASGAVTTLAGSSGTGSADGIGAAASFDYPKGITSDGLNLYVADYSNYTIRKIVIATGAVSTLAGQVGSYLRVDGVGSAASFRGPTGITRDGAYLYVTDSDAIRKISIATRAVTSVAGLNGNPKYANGVGSAAGFYYPEGLAVVGGALYVADRNNATIRKITGF